MYRKKSSKKLEVPSQVSRTPSNLPKTPSAKSFRSTSNALTKKPLGKENQSINLVANTKKTDSLAPTLRGVRDQIAGPRTRSKHIIDTVSGDSRVGNKTKSSAKPSVIKPSAGSTDLQPPSNLETETICGQKQSHGRAQKAESQTNSNAQSLMVSKFRIVRKMHESLLSSTFEAFHNSTGMIVCLKVFNKAKLKSQGLESQVIREIRFRSSLANKHSNIQRLFGFFSDDINIYLVEEYFPADNNASLILARRKRIHEQECRDIMKQILDGLLYIHSQGYCHRDIRVENLYICNGIVKIVDFSWVASMAQTQLRDTFCGSLQHAPPELLEGHSYNSSIDTWGLGTTLYHLAVGVHPNHDPRHPNINQLNFPIFLSNQLVNFLGRLIETKEGRIELADVASHPWAREWQVEGFVNREFWNFWTLNQ